MAIKLSDIDFSTTASLAIPEGNVIKITRNGNIVWEKSSGYTQVEYIGLTGTQYVDTGFKASNTTRVVMDFELTDTSVDNYIFGAYKPSGTIAVEMYYLWWSKTNNYYTMYTNGAGSSFTGFNGVAGLGRHLLDKNRNNTILDEVSISVSDSTFTTSYDMYLGTVNSGGTPRSTGMVGKIYSCQIYDNDVLIRDFIPCVDASGAVGLYDSVNDVFYENAGTGVFEAGPATSTKNVIISITQASPAPDYCYVQIGDTRYTYAQNITVASGTKVTFLGSSDLYTGGISVNGVWMLDANGLGIIEAYMDITDDMTVVFEAGGKYNYLHITTEDGKMYAYDSTISYIVPAKLMSIDNVSYAFQEGTNWARWITNGYNTGYKGSLFEYDQTFGVHCHTIENGYDMLYQVVYNNQVQGGSDTIIEGREYTLKVTNMGAA